MEIEDIELISIIEKDNIISVIELKVHENGYVDLTYEFNEMPSDLESAHLRKKPKIADIVKTKTNSKGYRRLRIHNNTLRNNRRESLDSKAINHARLQKEIDNSPIDYTLGYMPKMFVTCSMPRSKHYVRIIGEDKKERNVEVFESETRNGYYTLRVSAPVGIGLPYGVIPRMFFSWLCSEVMINKSRTISLGSSFSDFIKQLGYTVTGGKNGTISRVKEQLIRLCSCNIQFVHNKNGVYASMSVNITSNFFMSLKENKTNTLLDNEGTLELSEELFHSLSNDNVPINSRVLKKICQSSLAMDLYFWLTHRQSYLKKTNKN